jgi:hypothetical protein
MRSQDWAEDAFIDKEECLGPGGGEGGVVGEQKVQRVRVKESEGERAGVCRVRGVCHGGRGRAASVA